MLLWSSCGVVAVDLGGSGYFSFSVKISSPLLYGVVHRMNY